MRTHYNPNLQQKPVIHPIRRLCRRLFRLGVLYGGINLAFVGGAYVLEDRHFDTAVASGSRVDRVPASWWKRTFGSGRHIPSLSVEERQCVDSLTGLLGFKLTPEVFSRFYPSGVLDDSLFHLETIGEIQDAWSFLSLFYQSSTPVLLEIIRPKGKSDELYLRYDVEGVLKGIRLTYHFPCVMRIKLKKFEELPRGKQLRVTHVENRWFGGPLMGRKYFDNAAGTICDGCRRLNGFAMSIVLSRSELHHAPIADLTTPPVASATGAKADSVA
jgi:hypothetical protein